jgi:hypothetical protein
MLAQARRDRATRVGGANAWRDDATDRSADGGAKL